VALTFENSTDHHLVLASEMHLRIVQHLPGCTIAVAADIYTRHHLDFGNYRSAEQRRGGSIATELNTWIPILFPIFKGAHRISNAIL
jgi:hypothetical protein